MTSSNPIRLGGLAAVLAGALLVISDLLTLLAHELYGREGLAFGVGSSAGGSLLRSALALVAGVLLLLGLVGLYAHYSEAVGALGLVGFVGAFAGSVWGQQNFAFASSVAIFALVALLADVGWVLLGVAILRSRAATSYPRVGAMLLVAGAVLLGVVNALISVPITGLPAAQVAGLGVRDGLRLGPSLAGLRALGRKGTRRRTATHARTLSFPLFSELPDDFR